MEAPRRRLRGEAPARARARARGAGVCCSARPTRESAPRGRARTDGVLLRGLWGAVQVIERSGEEWDGKGWFQKGGETLVNGNKVNGWHDRAW